MDKFKPECLRKIANWTTIKDYHKFDKKTFDPIKTGKEIGLFSPKHEQLFKNINELDELDMKNHGKLFKHFIFSDLTQQGAKMVASIMISKGFKIIYNKDIKLYSDSRLLETKYKNFAVLLGTTVYDKPISVKAKKDILTKFNQRPDNVHGELCRFIILDKSYKEGIDLFDVKYAHILEPQVSKADLRQAIGRGTRMCGSKGLEFNPTQGWPLNVMLYDIELTPDLVAQFGEKTLFNLYLKHSNIDLRKIAFADQLEAATIHAAADYELNKTIHKFEINADEGYDLSWLYPEVTGGGGAEADGTEGGAIKRLSEEVNCKAGCRSRATKKVPIGTPLFTAIIFASNRELPNLKNSKPREYYCRLLKKDPNFCQEVRNAWKDPIAYLKKNTDNISKAIADKQHYKLPDYNRETFLRLVYEVIPQLKKYKAKKKELIAKSIEKEKENSIEKEKEKEESGKSTKSQTDSEDIYIAIESAKDSVLTKEAPVKEGPVAILKDEPGFLDIRNYVRENLSQYSWPKVTLENLCVTKGGGIVNFTPTQEFIRHYFTPSNPLKGILVWNSVGTGKTCQAIATASSSFENEGYTILWVTRSSLKSDIWKNMFEQVCSLSIQEKIKNGLKIPEDSSARMKLLSKAWSIRPMSYKQFSNLVAQKNTLYDDLVKKNGKDDPLRKTLLIIDEAHKLYGGADLSSLERPDMNKFHKALMYSYEKSGKDSVKLIMMTGTPITNDAMEMIKLLNLARSPDKQIPDDFNEFNKIYLDEQGKFTKKGKWQYLNDVAGQVCYLSREKDARQFPQPILTPINVDISISKNTFNTDTSGLINEISNKKLEKDNIAGDIKAIKDNFKNRKKTLQVKCKGLKKEKLEECKVEVAILAKELDESMLEKIKEKDNQKIQLNKEIKVLKQGVTKIKKSSSADVSQTGYLLDNCIVKPEKEKFKKIKKKINSTLSEYSV